MIPSFEHRHAPGGRLCPAFGGSNNDANPVTKTDASENQVAGGNDSLALSLNAKDSYSQLTVNTTDHAAVKTSLGLAEKTISANQSMFAGALTAVSQGSANNAAAMESANKELAKAYQSGNAGEQVMLKYAGFAVVGIAAIMAFKR